MFKNILVPTDGSALSYNAVKGAVRFAKEQKARITAVYVSPPYIPAIGESMPVIYFEPSKVYDLRNKAIARRHLSFVQKVAAAGGVRCDTIHATSDFPHQEIIRVAKRRKCDLVYMASRGRRGISRVILGSETSKVLAHSKVPVLVAR